MKRLTYISNFARPIPPEEIDEIGARSVRNNSRDGLSGVLFCFNNVFFQVIEGPADSITRTYARILKDPRHKDIFCLDVENGVTERKFADWAMKTVRLEESHDSLIQPIRSMLGSLAKTHYVLERYAPREVITGLQNGDDPLSWKLKPMDRTILFSDIFSSTTFAETLKPDQFENLVEAYYSIVNRSIVEHGGTISKLTGDGVMAYFKSSESAAAVDAAIEIARRLDDARASAEPNTPIKYLYAGVGLSSGWVREGNVGSDLKYDYTLLGDSVNSAARLESVTRKVKSLVVFDESVFHHLPDGSSARALGSYQPKGKSEKLKIYGVKLPYAERQIELADLKAAIRALK